MFTEISFQHDEGIHYVAVLRNKNMPNIALHQRGEKNAQIKYYTMLG